MKRYIQLTSFKATITSALLLTLLLTIGCKKEKALEPSNLDEDYFVVKDNPNDPVDHTIYQFYQSTGIASFYNDTIHRRRISDSAGFPRYNYVRLSLNYNLFGATQYRYVRLSSKTNVPACLTVIKDKVLPVLPDNLNIPSILLVDSFINLTPLLYVNSEDGWNAIQGFNTVGIKVVNAGVMTEEEKKTYAGSILAGMAEKRLNSLYAAELQKNFYSITRAAGLTLMEYDIYFGLPFFIFGVDFSTVPPAEQYGYLKYIHIANNWGLDDPLYTAAPANEQSDLRAFLTAIFRYTTAEFNAKYTNDELVLQKFGIVKNMAKRAGFKFAD